MSTLHRLDKSFGPGGSFAGLILVIIGVILVPFYWTTCILIIIGTFFGFSGSASEIDIDKRRVRPCYMFLVIFKYGEWIDIDLFTGIRVVFTTNHYRTFSLSNRTAATKQDDYRVVLEAGTPQSRVELMKCPTKEEATRKVLELAGKFGIRVLDN